MLSGSTEHGEGKENYFAGTRLAASRVRLMPLSRSSSAKHLYEDVYCQRGQMENLIKLHKAQLFSDRMSCHNATANQVRLGAG